MRIKKISVVLCTQLVVSLQAAVVLSGNNSSSFIQHNINASINTNGLLNKAFGQNPNNVLGTNYVRGSISNQPSEHIFDSIQAMALQPDGKIVVAGWTSYYSPTPRLMAFARFNPDGTLDTNFGQNTTYTTSFIPGTMYINTSVGGTTDLAFAEDYIYAMALQADGKIIAGGYVVYTNNDGTDKNYYFAVVRVLSDGSLDESFGGDGTGFASFIPGTVVINEGISGETAYGSINDVAYALALQNDGKIVLGGYSTDADTSYYALARFTTAGMLDQEFFSNDNEVTTTFPGAVFIQPLTPGSTSDECAALAIQSDGKIVAGGYSNDYSYAALARFLPNGSLDQSFGVIGEYTDRQFPGTVYISATISGEGSPTTNGNWINALALQPDGKILAGGLTTLDSFNKKLFALMRFNADGSLDSSFGHTGSDTKSSIPGTVFIESAIGGNTFNELLALARQVDGSIIIGGYAAGNHDTEPIFFVVAKFLSNGLLDATFGATNPGTTCPFPGVVYISKSISGAITSDLYDEANALLIKNDGNIVLGGYTYNDTTGNTYFALAEFFNPQTTASYQKAYSSVGAGLNV